MTEPTPVTILGLGSMGSALAGLCSRQGIPPRCGTEARSARRLWWTPARSHGCGSHAR